MSDLFGIGIPEEWTEEVLGEIVRWPEHRFYLLTKQPQNLIKWSPFPENCWVGVTATSDAMLTMAVTSLGHVKATVKYISIEPMLGDMQPPIDRRLSQAGINWVIIGAQTKPYKPPILRWVWEVMDACDSAGIPVFLKDNLARILLPYEPFYKFLRYPEATDIAGGVWKLRQEMP